MKKILLLIILLIPILVFGQKTQRKTDNSIKVDSVQAQIYRQGIDTLTTKKALRDTAIAIRNDIEFPYIKTLSSDIAWDGYQYFDLGANQKLKTFSVTAERSINLVADSSEFDLNFDSGIGGYRNWFFDLRQHRKGIEYAENYHKYYQQYTLVDKSYVDSVASGGGVTPTDNIFDWDATNNWYAPYSAKQVSMSIYTGSEAPNLTTRLNIDGYLYATSFRGNSSTSYGVYGLSTSSYGVYAGSTSSYGIYAYSTSGSAIRGSSTSGNALYASQEGILTSSISNDVLNVNKLNSSSSYNATGSLLLLNDNPSITNSIVSGSLIKGIIGSTERLRLDPRVKGNVDSTAFVLDTHRQLLSTDTLLSIKNQGVNKFQVLYDGGIISKGQIKNAQLTGSLTDGVPTITEINAIIGTASTKGAGYKVTIKDSDGTGLLYDIESDGTDWYYKLTTKAL
jgi:hypothetical protein